MQAQTTIDKMTKTGLLQFDEMTLSHECIKSNLECIEYLKKTSERFEIILDQDTFIFKDKSYVTRLYKEYFVGLDIIQFQIIADLS